MLATNYTNPRNLVSYDVAQIAAATKTIDFAAYSLTEAAIIQEIIEAAAHGVAVRVYLDRGELEAEARGNPALPNCPLRGLLNLPNVTVRVKASMVLMHLKSYCVDGKTVRDGSANFSDLGESQQDNSVTLTDDPAAAAAFAAKFTAMWSRPDNMSVEAAIEQSASYAHQRTRQH
jgi:phosphatidylserine/phosphatidylglycerophosphate/cardiolipin synthase-like enzyme